MDCSDHMDDVAWYLANEDLRPDLPDDQNVFTYVVGYHEDASLLEETAINGDGLYFEAKNAVELFTSIEYALQDILRRISAGSAVAVVSTERGTDDRLYRGKFMPSDWYGYLECYDLPYENGEFTANLARWRISYSFTPKMQIQALIQYNDLDEVLGTNLRFSWLRSANSGLFLVYNETREEYGVRSGFGPRDRSFTDTVQPG